MGSPKFTLNLADLKSIGKGMLIAAAGALATYIASLVGNIDIGPYYTPLIVAGLSVAINVIRKWVADNTVQ